METVNRATVDVTSSSFLSIMRGLWQPPIGNESVVNANAHLNCSAWIVSNSAVSNKCTCGHLKVVSVVSRWSSTTENAIQRIAGHCVLKQNFEIKTSHRTKRAEEVYSKKIHQMVSHRRGGIKWISQFSRIVSVDLAALNDHRRFCHWFAHLIEFDSLSDLLWFRLICFNAVANWILIASVTNRHWRSHCLGEQFLQLKFFWNISSRMFRIRSIQISIFFLYLQNSKKADVDFIMNLAAFLGECPVGWEIPLKIDLSSIF